MMNAILKTILIILAVAAVGFIAIQLVPIQYTNPPVVTAVKWDSQQTQALFQRSCADCHSNQTTWPWYSKVAPVSWLTVHDVDEGRGEFNIDDLTPKLNDLGRLNSQIERNIQGGEMPKAIYLPMHPQARLTADEKQALIDGLIATLTNGVANK
jgi:cytochrome c551/c552